MRDSLAGSFLRHEGYLVGILTVDLGYSRDIDLFVVCFPIQQPIKIRLDPDVSETFAGVFIGGCKGNRILAGRSVKKLPLGADRFTKCGKRRFAVLGR